MDLKLKAREVRKRRQIVNMRRSQEIEAKYHEEQLEEDPYYEIKQNRKNQKGNVKSRKMEMRERYNESKTKKLKDAARSSKSRNRSSSHTKRINSTVVRLAKQKKKTDPRIAQRSKERIKRKLKKERKNLKAEAGRKGRRMYPEMNRSGKTFGGVDQWNKAYEKATGANVGKSRDPDNFYQGKNGKIKHKMTKSARLRLIAAEERKRKHLKKSVRIEE